MCEYTGHHRTKIESIVEQNGGELHFDVTFLQRDKIASGYFFLENDQLRLSCEGSLFHNVTQMYTTLDECGFGIHNYDRLLGTGNVAVNISGVYNMFDNIITELRLSLAELISNDSLSSKTKSPRIGKSKDLKMLKADKRIMRPEGAKKGDNVWNPEYIKTKQIDESRCYELWGGKVAFYTALKTITVYEFETTYGIRTK